MSRLSDNMVLLEEYGVLFKKDETGYFIPVMYDAYKTPDGKIKGEKISEDSHSQLGIAYYYLIMFVKQCTGIRNRQGVMQQGHLELYQWVTIMGTVGGSVRLENEEFLSLMARQIGKSHVARLFISFSVTFLPLIVEIHTPRWFSILASIKKSAVKHQLQACEPTILRGVKLFNQLFPNSKLVFDDYVKEDGKKRKLKWNSEVIEINRVIEDETVPYSSLNILSMEKSVSNVGYTAHAILLDEAGLLDAELVAENILPILASTSGVLYSIGTANYSNTGFLQQRYLNGIGNIYEFDAYEAIELKTMVSEENAKNYKRAFEKAIRDYGLNSVYVQTMYLNNVNAGGNKLFTEKMLKRNKVFSPNPRYIIDENRKYRVAGFDPSYTNDIACMIIMDIGYDKNNNLIHQLTKIEILKDKESDKISPNQLKDGILTLLEYYKIDYLMQDTTANQENLFIDVYDSIQESNLGTMPIPYNFSARNKQTMYEHLEEKIFDQKLKFPSSDFKDPAFVELTDEMYYMEKEISKTGRKKYLAPEGKSYYDDCVDALALANYCVTYVTKNINKKIDLGSGKAYRIKHNKYEKNPNSYSKSPKTWLFG